MGGNALKIVKTRRYKLDEFNKTWKEKVYSPFMEYQFVSGNDFEFLDTIDLSLVQSFKSKSDFGDMDVLVRTKHKPHEIKELIQLVYNPDEIFREKNSNVISFNVDELQVDFIVTHPENWHTSINYFSYNDLHNLLGKMVHRLGLKLGHDGLKYKCVIDNRYMGDIIISKNWPDIYRFLGLDWETYERGFDTVEDIFEYVTTCDYFQKELFKFENLRVRDKKRNKKRKNYKLFLEWLEVNADKIENNFVHTETPAFWFLEDLITDYFGNKFKHEHYKYRQEAALFLQMKIKFNGEMVMSLIPGLQGKELGKFIEDFKAQYENEWESYVLNSTVDEIMRDIVKFHQNN